MMLPALERSPESAQSSARILLVHYDGASPVAGFLVKRGCRVTCVRSPLDAERLIMVERRPFDAVLASVFEHESAPWVGRLRRRKPAVAVILLGASAAGAHAAQEVIAALGQAACACGSRPIPIDSSAATSASTKDITQSPV
jgi:hypothetical protein